MTPAPLYPAEIAVIPKEAYAFIPPNLPGLEEAVNGMSLHAPATPGEPNAALSARMRIAELVWVGRNRWFLEPKAPYDLVFYRTLIKELGNAVGAGRFTAPTAPKPTVAADVSAAEPPKAGVPGDEVAETGPTAPGIGGTK